MLMVSVTIGEGMLQAMAVPMDVTMIDEIYDGLGTLILWCFSSLYCHGSGKDR
jgi:hypothetical protein